MIALDALIQAHEPLRYCTKPGSRFASGRAAARRSPNLRSGIPTVRYTAKDCMVRPDEMVTECRCNSWDGSLGHIQAIALAGTDCC
jgi:hypothetical protein